jgi:D-xylose transport system ATP-binding protein
MSPYILEMQNVTKEFPGVKALDNVNLQVMPGHIHGLVGENGAGKSTLMKILSGVYSKGTYMGEIRIDGTPVAFKSIRDSEKAGISIIYQELMMVPELSIAENIFLGRYGNVINWDKVNSEAKKWMEQVGLDENPSTLVKDIGIGKQQLVEIAKALSLNAKLLILDEPTAALTEKEVSHLLEKLREIKNNGVTCIYISHKLEEVLAICDEVTILRDGVTVSSHQIDELDEKKMISKMVGRDFSNRFPQKVECAQGEVAFEVRNINLIHYDNSDKYILRDISFNVKKGEIVGIAGLMGAGRTELVNSLFGDFKGRLTGEIFVADKKVRIKSPQDAIDNGLGLVTEDRKLNGLNLIDTIENNITMASLGRFCRLGVINKNKAIKSCDEISKRIRIKATSLETLAMNLSGGNQQKVVLAKWLMVCPSVLIIDEPTRGIDVGAKYEIYTLMNELKQQGIAIIMVSSELPEIIGMSDRILVLKEGRLTGEFYNQDISEELIMERAMGGTKK